MDATLIIYTGIATPTIPISPGQNLQTILQNIDTAINTMNPAPDYSGYNLYCVTQTDGVTHPTNTENFAEGISKILCDLITDYTAFVTTDYVADQLVITNAINDLQDPALTYSAFNIVNTDTIQQVYAKLFTGFTTMSTYSSVASADWTSLGLGTPTNVYTAFDKVIDYSLALTSTVAGKQASLGTFDNSANCLSGGATDSALTTINLIRTYVCTLPTFDASSITWGCISSQTDLQDTIDAIISYVSTQTVDVVTTAGTGLTATSLGACAGKSIEIDTTWTGLYKVAISNGDAQNGDADFLGNKVTSLDGSITIDISTNSDMLDLSVNTPAAGKVLVNSADTTADYLETKIPSAIGDWGIGINSQTNFNDSQLILAPTMSNPDLFINNFLDYIATEPELLAKFCALITACDGCLCSTIEDLIVSLDLVNVEFDLTWTPTGGTTTSQVGKYREVGQTTWQTGNFNPANIFTAAEASVTVENLNSNTIYEFQIDSNCPGDVSNSNIYQAVIYKTATVTYTVAAGVVKVNQNPLSTLSTVDYRLKSGATVLETIAGVSASDPKATFGAQSSGSYTLEWRYAGVVNGVTLYSDDSSQANAWYTLAVTIP